MVHMARFAQVPALPLTVGERRGKGIRCDGGVIRRIESVKHAVAG